MASFTEELLYKKSCTQLMKSCDQMLKWHTQYNLHSAYITLTTMYACSNEPILVATGASLYECEGLRDQIAIKSYY